jgi:glycine cleavage system regulatory protein
MASLVVTIIGKDRSGLVNSVAAAIAKHGGNWEQSNMSHLAGHFAGIVLVTVPDASADHLSAALEEIETTGLLSVTVERAQQSGPTPTRSFALELVGQDRPGIIHDISHALASKSVSIAELETQTRSAPMAGGTLFEAKATLSVPLELFEEDLRQVLQDLADRLLVDIELNDEVE